MHLRYGPLCKGTLWHSASDRLSAADSFDLNHTYVGGRFLAGRGAGGGGGGVRRVRWCTIRTFSSRAVLFDFIATHKRSNYIFKNSLNQKLSRALSISAILAEFCDA